MTYPWHRNPIATKNYDHISIYKPKDYREFSLSLLLCLQLISTFILVPLVDFNGSDRWILNIFVVTTGFASVLIVDKFINRCLVMFSIGLCVVGVTLAPLITDSKTSEVIVIVAGFLFSVNVCWILFSKVFNSSRVTLHRIRAAITLYLNISVLFALTHSLIASFMSNAYSSVPKNPGDLIQTMIYFSMATITTAGYGDFVPVHPFARSVAMLEAVIGQCYMGILIATLVGQFVAHNQKNFDDIPGRE